MRSCTCKSPPPPYYENLTDPIARRRLRYYISALPLNGVYYIHPLSNRLRYQLHSGPIEDNSPFCEITAPNSLLYNPMTLTRQYFFIKRGLLSTVLLTLYVAHAYFILPANQHYAGSDQVHLIIFAIYPSPFPLHLIFINIYLIFIAIYLILSPFI